MELVVLLAALLQAAPALPVVRVTHDDTVIDRSCRVEIAAGAVIRDENDDGVIHIRKSGIHVDFSGSELRGAEPGARPDELTGKGIVIDGADTVTIGGARVSGFKVGVYARGVRGLLLEDLELTNLFRQRLRSTPEAENVADWLHPHDNDRNEWMTRYGAAVYVEDSGRIRIARCRGRHSQNGILLDRVWGARIVHNDFSFLSGWGLGLWRSSGNEISGNRFDFCVRGYSHGVYNRGQDSAGILMFEQCYANRIEGNSATHGGDGLFAFAGREALGQAPAPSREFEYARCGNNENSISKNDLSYAAAHGLELTFSFGNSIRGNRLVGNAICGIWGGYSRDTLIEGNFFEGNGDEGYGLERGAINIEHGQSTFIRWNFFRRNACGVHLWWDADEAVTKTPWARANGMAVADNVIAGNSFVGDRVALHLRETGRTTRAGDNSMSGVGREVDATQGSEPRPLRAGEARPAGSRYGRPRSWRFDFPPLHHAELAGRDEIIMTEWGPWDHESLLIRRVRTAGASHEIEVRNRPPDLEVETFGDEVEWATLEGDRWRVTADRSGVFDYTIRAGGQEVRGRLINATWALRFFPWTVDPRRDLDGWRKEAHGERACVVQAAELSLPFAMGGPSGLALGDAVSEAALPTDRFGLIATTRLPLRPGTWRFTTLSDDGVRVRVNDELVIDNWTWHGPTRDAGEVVIEEGWPVDILVEHFELDGYAVLELDLQRVE